ncbi:hypothetical protein V8G61_09340 [Gaetbulibacter sp. M240]|uniref:hypothetical protein n=1 Tax=Gaetbulibacter sp. M240 TaxID=3126511 RepID=UPI00374FB6DD
MKKLILILMVISFVPFLNSCEEDVLDVKQPEAYNPTWMENATLTFSPQGESKNFVYKINNGTGEEFWGTTELTFNVTFESESTTIENIAKIDFYAFAEEKIGEDYNYIGGSTGKLLTSVSNPAKTFDIVISKDMIYNLFESEFSSTTRTDVNTGDLYELKWVITGKDGNIVDTRRDCFGVGCTYAFEAELAIVDTWIGVFDYKWIEVGTGTVRYSHAKINVGSTGTVEFVPGANEGEYDCLDMSFGGAYGGPRGGTLKFDASNNVLTIISAESYYDSEWEVVSATDDVLTLYWTNRFTALYSEYGTIEIRRSDGLQWPVPLSIVKL